MLRLLNIEIWENPVIQKCFLYFGALMLSLVSTLAQANAVPETVAIGQVKGIDSKVLEEHRPVFVHLPEGYEEAADTRYPVLYVLDGGSHFNYSVGVTDRLSESANAIPEHIVVAIPNVGQSRIRDFRLSGPGGAEAFSRFLGSELVPYMDRHYRTQPYRLLAGHSSAGLFTLYALAEHPGVFNAYIAMSPWLPGNEAGLADALEQRFAETLTQPEFLYVTVGKKENNLRPAVDELKNLLERKAPGALNWRFDILAFDSHMTTPAPSLHNALLHLYEGYNLPFDAAPVVEGEEAVQAYYRNFGKRLGYKVEIPDEVTWNLVAHRMLDGEFKRAKTILNLGDKPLPESMLHNNGYYALRQNQPDRARAIFEQYVRDYPDRPNAYDSLADALEAGGQLEEALKAMNRACKLAEDQKDQQLDFYREHRHAIKQAIRESQEK